MQKLPDKNVFDLKKIPLSTSEADSRFYYIPHRRSYKAYPLSFSEEERVMMHVGIVYEVQLQPGAHYRRENAHFLSVEYLHEGELMVKQEDRCYLLESGDIFLMQPEADNEFMIGPKGGCLKSSLTIYGPVLQFLLDTSGLNKIDVLTNIDCSRFEDILRRFKELSKASSDYDAMERNSLLCYELLQFLKNPEKKNLVPEGLSKLQTYLESHLDSEIPLAAMTRISGYSRTHLIRLIRELYKKTPHQLLIDLRMKKAAQLLLSGNDLLIKEIAGLCGYPNSLNFSTAFKQYFNLSPQKYRQHNNIRLVSHMSSR